MPRSASNEGPIVPPSVRSMRETRPAASDTDLAGDNPPAAVSSHRERRSGRRILVKLDEIAKRDRQTGFRVAAEWIEVEEVVQ